MKKNLSFFSFFLCLLLLTACSTPAAPVQETTFSAALTEVTEPPESTPSDTPAETPILFTMPDDSTVLLTVRLPENWSIAESADAVSADQEKYLYLVGKDKKYIADETGTYVGAIDCAAYTPYEGSEDSPQAIFVKIALGNGYNFGIYDTLTTVSEHTAGFTFRTDVHLSAAFRAAWTDREAKNNHGILSYNRDTCTYIAIELDSSFVDKKTADYIATGLAWEKTS